MARKNQLFGEITQMNDDLIKQGKRGFFFDDELKAARLSRAYMVGVDHIIFKNKPYLLEINGSQGSGADYEGYSYEDYYADAEPSGRIDGETMMSNVIDWIKERKHWDRQSLLECGWLETVDLDEVGKVRVK